MRMLLHCLTDVETLKNLEMMSQVSPRWTVVLRAQIPCALTLTALVATERARKTRLDKTNMLIAEDDDRALEHSE